MFSKDSIKLILSNKKFTLNIRQIVHATVSDSLKIFQFKNL